MMEFGGHLFRSSLSWLGLLALLALTVTLAYLPLGAFNTAAALGIGAIKAVDRCGRLHGIAASRGADPGLRRRRTVLARDIALARLDGFLHPNLNGVSATGFGLSRRTPFIVRDHPGTGGLLGIVQLGIPRSLPGNRFPGIRPMHGLRPLLVGGLLLAPLGLGDAMVGMLHGSPPTGICVAVPNASDGEYARGGCTGTLALLRERSASRKVTPHGEKRSELAGNPIHDLITTHLVDQSGYRAGATIGCSGGCRRARATRGYGAVVPHPIVRGRRRAYGRC